jgi:hypothetical protein
MFVVVRHIAHQHHLQLTPAEDPHLIQHLTTNRAHPPFRERVRPRCPHRCAQDLDALGAEDRIEAVGVWAALGPRHRKGAGLWGSYEPASVGAPTRSSITCQTCLSSWFSFQMPYAVPTSTGGTATSPIAPLTAASTHSWPPRPMLS